MYEQAKQLAMSACAGSDKVAVFERTVAENIDFKIAALKAEIERLEASKVTLAPLLAMRISDIREAMIY